MNLTLKVWRQKNTKDQGKMVDYKVSEISPDMSFLEMFDVLNEDLITKGDDPIAFDHDCREGICGMCSMFINGRPHGPKDAVTTCQLHMRSFKDGDTIVVEPWRAKAFPVVKDLTVDRSAFDRVIAAGGFVLAVLLIALRLIFGAQWAADGVFTLFAVLFMFIGTQFVAMGLLGVYIGRIYNDVRARPRYFIQKVVGADLKTDKNQEEN